MLYALKIKILSKLVEAINAKFASRISVSQGSIPIFDLKMESFT